MFQNISYLFQTFATYLKKLRIAFFVHFIYAARYCACAPRQPKSPLADKAGRGDSEIQPKRKQWFPSFSEAEGHVMKSEQ
jgi:hypothetical protein